MNQPTRGRILEAIPKDKVGAEVGVWAGSFSQQILEVAQPRRLYLIDPWQVRMEETYATAVYGRNAGVDMDKLHRSVVDRFRTDARVTVMRMTSAEALASFDDEALDFVYIDGDHAYEAVKTDLALAFRKVVKGGLIAGDDYMLGKWWGDGVVRAVNEFIGSQPVKIGLVLGAQFLLRKL
jgi:predicted O-methyltransferase YrrM